MLACLFCNFMLLDGRVDFFNNLRRTYRTYRTYRLPSLASFSMTPAAALLLSAVDRYGRSLAGGTVRYRCYATYLT